MLGFIKQYKLLIIIAVLVIAGALAYQFALTDDQGNIVFLAEDTGVSGTTVGHEIIGLLSELKAIDLRGDIFQEPAFQSLKDFQKGIGREPIGRSNPFLPLGQGGGAVGFVELPIIKISDSTSALQQEPDSILREVGEDTEIIPTGDAIEEGIE